MLSASSAVSAFLLLLLLLLVLLLLLLLLLLLVLLLASAAGASAAAAAAAAAATATALGTAGWSCSVFYFWEFDKIGYTRVVSEQNRVPFFSRRGALTQLASCVWDLPCWVEVI